MPSTPRGVDAKDSMSGAHASDYIVGEIMAVADIQSQLDLGSVELGGRRHFELPVAQRASGETLTIHVHVQRGREPGPTLGLVGTVHGDAVFGGYAVMHALSTIGTDFRGTLVGVPVANPVAFESGTRTTGQGWNTDMNNMNRVFPGNRDGWVTQQMAAVIAEEVIPQLDAVIDYHCGGSTSINYTLVNGDKTPEEKRIFNYCRLMGTEFIFVHDSNPFTGTLDQYARSLGKLVIVAEQGGNVLPDGFLNLSMTRVRNFMKGLGMVDGVPDLPKTQLVMRRRVIPRIKHGGLFVPEHGSDALAKIVPGGTVLGRVYDLHRLELLDEMTAPYERSAVLMARTVMGRVNPGDYAYIIADADSGEEIGPLEDWRIEI